MGNIKDLFGNGKEKEVKRNFEMVDINLLHSGLKYQRKLDEKFIRDTLKKFDKNEVNAPLVSLRDGKYNVVDGQHTIAICKEKGWNRIRCEIRKNLTEEEESQWFNVTNTKHRPQSKSSILNSRYFGNDEELNKLIKALASVGYKLKTVDITDSDGVIDASVTIESIYNEMKQDDFVNCLTLHQGVWNGEKESLKASFLKGMFKFHNTYKTNIDEKRFVKALSKCTAEKIKVEAETDKFTKDIAVKYARVLVAYYNKGIQKDKQLKISLLED
jgi:hypothetical protein